MDCPDAIAGQEVRDKDGEEVKLRTVALPEDLISKFLEIAKANSDRNIETLGTFGGQLCNNKFRVTHLLIPKQQGQSDSCTMEWYEDELRWEEQRQELSWPEPSRQPTLAERGEARSAGQLLAGGGGRDTELCGVT